MPIPPYPQPAPPREYGMIAFLVATVATYKLAAPFLRWFEGVLRDNGIDAGFSLLDTAAIVMLWVAIRGIVQAVIDLFKEQLRVWWATTVTTKTAEGGGLLPVLLNVFVVVAVAGLIFYIAQTLRGHPS